MQILIFYSVFICYKIYAQGRLFFSIRLFVCDIRILIFCYFCFFFLSNFYNNIKYRHNCCCCLMELCHRSAARQYWKCSLIWMQLCCTLARVYYTMRVIERNDPPAKKKERKKNKKTNPETHSLFIVLFSIPFHCNAHTILAIFFGLIASNIHFKML